ncbi:MAG TPA: glycosyltransferase [Polyangiaceae bacterium]|nr:glycosyltransferase [Polyangiaceae bacterium]
MSDVLPRVSVVVPAYNEAAHVLDCVAALKAQTYPRELLEIVVIDNGSSDGTFELLQAQTEIVTAQERTPGSYAARNRGLELARGDVMAFTDADCMPDMNWVKNAVAHLRAGVGIVAGHVGLEEHPGPLTTSELFERCFAFKQAENARLGLCVTANWFSPRAVLDEVGGFDGLLLSGGDHELSRAIAARGYRVVYARDASVRHPARKHFADLMRKRRRVVGGAFTAKCKRAGKPFPLFMASLVKETLERLYTTAGHADLEPSERVRVAGLLLVMCGVSLLEAARLELGSEALRE